MEIITDPVVIEMLHGIVRYYKKSSVVFTYEMVALQLRRHVCPEPTWAWRYIWAVDNHKLKASSKLKKAIFMEYTALGIGDWPIKLERVEILAPVGLVEPSALVFQKSRLCEKCKTVSFTPNSPNQKYCYFCQEKNHRKKWQI